MRHALHRSATAPARSGFQQVFAGHELSVALWTCSGGLRPWGVEEPAATELILQREGVHSVRFGRRTSTVDLAAFSLVPAGRVYLRNAPTPHPQRTTYVFARGALSEALRGVEPRVAMTTPLAAVLHRALLRATDPLELQERAYALWAEIVAAGQALLPPLPPRHSWQVLADDARHALAHRFAERLSLDQLATELRVSPFHLARVFRVVTGASIHRYQTRLRLRAALHTLAGERVDLSRLALELGFHSHSHFTNAFTREYGRAPSRL